MESNPRNSDQVTDLAPFAEALNEELRKTGADSAERAFGIGCGVGLLPVVIIILLLFVFQMINLILAIILLILFMIALVGVAMLVASLARTNSIKRQYHSSVLPQIDGYLQEHHLSRQEFNDLVHPLLPEDAPFQAFLSQVDTNYYS